MRSFVLAVLLPVAASALSSCGGGSTQPEPDSALVGNWSYELLATAPVGCGTAFCRGNGTLTFEASARDTVSVRGTGTQLCDFCGIRMPSTPSQEESRLPIPAVFRIGNCDVTIPEPARGSGRADGTATCSGGMTGTIALSRTAHAALASPLGARGPGAP